MEKAFWTCNPQLTNGLCEIPEMLLKDGLSTKYLIEEEKDKNANKLQYKGV